MPLKRNTIIKIIIGIAAFIIIYNLLYFTEVEYLYPIWSKDGKRIYYVKNIDYYRFAQGAFFFEYRIYKNKSYVMSMNSDGSWKKVLAKFVGYTEKFPRHLSLSDLTIAPDGKILLFCLSSDEREKGIYSIGTKGGRFKSLITYEKYNPYDIRNFFVSPDSKKIIYTSERHISSTSGIDRFYSAWLVNIDGTDNHMICEEDSHAAGWTIDNKAIISKFNDLSVYDPLSSSIIKQTKTHGFSGEEFEASMKSINVIEKTYISPDSKKKIFQEEKSFGVMDMDGKNKKVLLKDKVHYLKGIRGT